MSAMNGHNKFSPGDKVRVMSARHPDVIAGTIGTVDGAIEDGYGVAITGSWYIAGSDRGACKFSTEVVWFPPAELQAI